MQQRHDVRVGKPRRQLHFAAEPIAVDPGRQVGRQHLDDDLAAEGVLPRHKDAAHAATGELALYGVGISQREFEVVHQLVGHW